MTRAWYARRRRAGRSPVAALSTSPSMAQTAFPRQADRPRVVSGRAPACSLCDFDRSLARAALARPPPARPSLVGTSAPAAPAADPVRIPPRLTSRLVVYIRDDTDLVPGTFAAPLPASLTFSAVIRRCLPSRIPYSTTLPVRNLTVYRVRTSSRICARQASNPP